MEDYDQNVAIVMNFMGKHHYGTTAICQHKRCYKLLKAYLEQNHLNFSSQIYDSWYVNFRESLPSKSNSHKGMYLALQRLQDVYDVGNIREIHTTLSKPPYHLLDAKLRAELDDFISFKKKQNYPDSYTSVLRSTGARFMHFLMSREVSSITECSYDDIFAFFERNNQPNNAHKDRCDCIASDMLNFYSTVNPKLFGISLALNKIFIHQIVKDFSFLGYDSNVRDVVPIESIWKTIELFLLKMNTAQYSDAVLKTSRHILELLYISRDMYNQAFDENTIWIWFGHASEHFGTGWKQYRRTLAQFILFAKTGCLTTSVTGVPHKQLGKDKLSDSLKTPLEDFLLLKKREGMAKSTCDMYCSSIVRLAQFLHSQGIEFYSDITSNLLVDFNKQDHHATAEGKRAYNCKIRWFLIYLIEEGIVENPYIFNSVPTVVASRITIPQVLTKAEILTIMDYQISDEDADLLRTHAMVMLGLFIGLRSSDVAALKFSNIDWSHRCISIIQQKTGKYIKLYLPVKAGNALYRYLKYGRPHSELPYVFINHRAPYNNLHKSVCVRALYRLLPSRKASTVGFHILRKTFATNMLQDNNNTQIIADALGHKGDSALYAYLGMNPDKMRLCALPLSATGSQWMGGDFFD